MRPSRASLRNPRHDILSMDGYLVVNFKSFRECILLFLACVGDAMLLQPLPTDRLVWPQSVNLQTQEMVRSIRKTMLVPYKHKARDLDVCSCAHVETQDGTCTNPVPCFESLFVPSLNCVDCEWPRPESREWFSHIQLVCNDKRVMSTLDQPACSTAVSQ